MPPAFETGEPTSAMELSHALGAQLAAGATYLATLPDAAFFTPQGAAWSPAEHVRHLRKSTAPLVHALKLPRWALGLRFGIAARPSRSFTEMRDADREMLAFTVYHTAHHLRRVAERAAA